MSVLSIFFIDISAGMFYHHSDWVASSPQDEQHNQPHLQNTNLLSNSKTSLLQTYVIFSWSLVQQATMVTYFHKPVGPSNVLLNMQLLKSETEAAHLDIHCIQVASYQELTVKQKGLSGPALIILVAQQSSWYSWLLILLCITISTLHPPLCSFSAKY